jgi:hypothetical protein
VSGQSRKDRERERHERTVAKIAARALLAGETICVEECPNERYGRLVGSTKRWVLTVGRLQPGEALMLDPRQFAEGTELGAIHPGRLRWPVEAWMTYFDLSIVLIVSKKRLYNLVTEHKLERRALWIGRGRERRRITHLPPATVRRLAELTSRHHLIVPPTS